MSENGKKSHVKAIVITIIIILLIAAVTCLGFLVYNKYNGKDESKSDGKIKTSQGEVKITKSDAKEIEYETFDNGLVSFEHPKGWKVDIYPTDYIHYSFKVYDPDNPTRMFLFALKQEGALKSERARQVWLSLYPDSPFGYIEPIDPQTTEGYYKAYPKNAELNNKTGNINYFPKLNNFKVIENLGKDLIGGDILRATFTDENGKNAQGIFTATVSSVGEYKINENPFDFSSPLVDVWPLNTYNVVLMTAPEEEFIEWQEALDNCYATIQFSSDFISGFNAQEDAILRTVQANAKVYDEISDMIMDSWEKRNSSYDITSQKQSDATLGYERVYDTETGDIYKAYNGFTDDYKGDRYKPITDDMYTEAIAGYIEK